ncbi:unnamed protein product, partial [Adineta steineri]
IPSMYLQNVTSINSTINNLLFNYHYINITSSLPISVHFEIHSLNRSLAYLFIYKFDQTPQLNSSINIIDGWTMFCPSNLTNDDIYRYFIDNQQTPGHQSLIFGIRELNSTEINNYCLNNSSINTSLPITDQPFNFTSNYELRIYTSGCYYLDENNNWKSDGLIVRSLTNLYQTECLSTHLTTFAGGFIVLPEPINWSYVFANADFMKNKTIYLTVICMSIAYIILMIFGRFKDKKDIEKLGVTPLPDNDKSDQYYYQIIVFTGQRANSGTQSKVHFILSSDNDETRVRTFSDPHRKIFQRGGIDSFIMSVPNFVSNIRAQQWYNDDQPVNLNGYINDKTNRMIGWATMRQLRSKSELCSDQRVISTCIDDYSLFNEEKDSFQPGWILNQTSTEEDEDYSSSILKAFQYQSSKELDTYVYVGDYGTYSGDGYVYEFRGRLSDIKSNLSLLHQLQWIDSKTRAVIIQFTLYNPNVALYTSVTFLLEFLSASGVHSSARFEPLNFYVFTSLTQLICTIIYICFIIYFLIIEIKLLMKLKLKYFYEFWSIIQIGIISCSITSIIIYIWRSKEYNRLSSLFRETNGYVYVNLEMIVYVDDVLTSLLGFCCFFGTIKFIKFIRFNKSLRIFVQTLKYVTKELISFSLMFSIVFMAFLALFYLLFNSSIASCSSLLSTAQMLFETTLMSFDVTDFTGADPFLGPFCFSIFIIIVVFVCLSMFISILNDGFHHVEQNSIEDQQIFSYMLKKFLNWTRKNYLINLNKNYLFDILDLRRPNVEEIYELQDSRMRSHYVDPIENFPDIIDQFLEAINRIYIDQKKELLKLTRAGV